MRHSRKISACRREDAEGITAACFDLPQAAVQATKWKKTSQGGSVKREK
jgi:hypothetical protein